MKSDRYNSGQNDRLEDLIKRKTFNYALHLIVINHAIFIFLNFFFIILNLAIYSISNFLRIRLYYHEIPLHHIQIKVKAMANVSNLKGRYPYPGLDLSDFITSSKTFQNNPKYPLNYPYNIYGNANAWESGLVLEELQEESRFSRFSWRKLCWWRPNSDNVAAEFLESSSMHGLKYVSEQRRNLVERLFWLGAFISCVVVAAVKISEIWQRYYDNPVIVTFNPTEVDVDAIPFPAITICNTNPFSLARIKEFERIYETSDNEAERNAALEALRVINGLCSTQESFLKERKHAQSRGVMRLQEASEPPSDAAERNLTQFLYNNTQPCREFLRICVWQHEEIDCQKLFKPIITDFGKCCTFNMLPQALMEIGDGHTPNVVENTKRNVWSSEEIKEWKRWNFDDDGYILHPDWKYPRRQRRAGNANGLSLLLDPDIANSFCPATDSNGIKILYHTPLDVARVADLALMVDINREVFIEINADLTIADDSIQTFPPKSRRCYFGMEYTLEYYKPYTRSNCLEECWIKILRQNCSCVLYYSPHNASTDICSTKPGSINYNCIMENERRYSGQLTKICPECMYSCNDLDYNAQVTYAKLQPPEILWSGGPNDSASPWMSRKISTVHIYMGGDSVGGKLRQKLYQTVDLIANTGGLLGLFIGFSVLSAVEIVYFTTMRICCRRLRKSKRFGEHQA